MIPRRQKAEQAGAALALVLWAVFVIATVAIVILKLVSFDLSMGETAARRFIARGAALSGIALASNPKLQPFDPVLSQTFEDGGHCEVTIRKEDARVNINTLLASGNTEPLKKLFQLWGLSDDEADIAVDSLKDWVDADDFRSLHGAEASDISDDSPYSRPENRPFFSVDEMATVRGMDAVSRLKPDWMDFFSVYSSGVLDSQETNEDLLEAFGGLNSDQAHAIVQFRNGPDGKFETEDDVKIESVDALAAIVSLSPENLATLKSTFGVGGNLRRILSIGSMGNLKHKISAIAVTGASPQKYLEWIEN